MTAHLGHQLRPRQARLQRDRSAGVQRAADGRGLVAFARRHGVVGARARRRDGVPASSPASSTRRRRSPRATGSGWLGLGLVGHCLLPVLLHRRAVAHQRRQQRPAHRRDAGAHHAAGRRSAARARSAALHWAGAAAVAGRASTSSSAGARTLAAASLRGDMMMLVAVVCWAVYTLGARPLMVRHSPVGVTGLSMMIGSLIYVPLACAAPARQCDWRMSAPSPGSRSSIRHCLRSASRTRSGMRRCGRLAVRGRRSTRTWCRSSRW